MGYNWANQSMKRILLGLSVVVLALTTSCSTVKVVPQAKSTINAVSLGELRLTNEDYSVLNTISADAIISVSYNSDNTIEVQDVDRTFSYKLKPVGKKGSGVYMLDKTDGVIRAGFLSNNPGILDLACPEDVARGVAVYRIISMSQELGSDGLIEPVISTNIEGASGTISSLNVVYKITVTAKPIKLKVTGK